MHPVLREFMRRIYEEKVGQFRAIRVQKDGKLWGEVYHAPRVPYNVHSVSKSFMATAVGMAVEEGILRSCSHSRECRMGEEFFRIAAAIQRRYTGVFQDELPLRGGKIPAQTAFHAMRTASNIKADQIFFT